MPFPLVAEMLAHPLDTPDSAQGFLYRDWFLVKIFLASSVFQSRISNKVVFF